MSLLLLGGTAEARRLAEALADLPGARVSLAGETDSHAPHGLPVRKGGFGGAEGLARYLNAEAITAVLDATHPFATSMSATARAACDEAGVPYRQLLRPAWRPLPGEVWRRVPDPAEAVPALPSGTSVLWAAGRKALAAVGTVPEMRLWVRVAEPRRDPPPVLNARWLVARPPLGLPQEMAMMRRYRIEWLVAKNAGGAARAKLEAARRLGVHVVMIERPSPPLDRCFETVEDALDWVRSGSPA